MIGQEVCVAQPPPHQHQLRMYVCVLFNMIRAVVIEVYFPDLHLLGAGGTSANYNPPASIFSFRSHLQHTDGCSGSSRSRCWYLQWHQQKLLMHNGKKLSKSAAWLLSCG